MSPIRYISIISISALLMTGCGDASYKNKGSRKSKAVVNKQTHEEINQQKHEELNQQEQIDEKEQTKNTDNISDVSASKSTWVDQMLLKIEQALDQNPVAISQNLPQVQSEIFQKAGFQLSCDDGWGGFKNYELKLCYTAIKALLVAIKEGLTPLNPMDGISIEEIKIVKTGSRLYEPVYGRHGLEVNYLITSSEWPALLKTEIEGFARTRRVYRNNQVADKTQQMMIALSVNELVAGDSVELVNLEKGIHSLEQALGLKDQITKDSVAKSKKDILSDKMYEGIRINKKAKDLYEDDGIFYVDISFKQSPIEILKHLVRQPNKEGRDLSSDQLQILNLTSNTEEYRTRALAGLQNSIMRSKIKRLQSDIQYHMLEGKVEIEINLDRTVNCSYFVFCKSAGVTIAQAYQFLMDLREAISGGRDLTEMKVKKIEFKNKVLYEGIISKNNQHILFGTNAVPTSIYRAIWYTTPQGIQHLSEVSSQPDYVNIL